MLEPADTPLPTGIGVVIIGRNERPHLSRALDSIPACAAMTVYADGDSSDDSAEWVEQAYPTVKVVRVDTSCPPSPSRGRNTGYAVLTRELASLRHVQFLDGDCQLCPSWLPAASAYLDANEDVGVVGGRLRERERERNIYHRLADMEWDAPPGDVDSMGGIMMVRAAAWAQVGGQHPGMIAAEEKEFCQRILLAGHRVVRLPNDMALHNIDMTTFGQWWTRSLRMGHACAHGLWVHRDRAHTRRLVSLLTYALVVPGVALGGATQTSGLALLLFAVYIRLWSKLVRSRRKIGDPPADARLYATANILNKLPGALGVGWFVGRLLLHRRAGPRTPPSARSDTA
ncbi:MAG: glycosyltransferase family A protein [Nannocystaceae bacterium]